MSSGRAVVAVIALLSGFTLHGQCSTVSFRGAAEWYGGQQPVALKFANINGDRWPDLVVASRDQNGKPLGGLTVLVGDGGRLWPVHQELVPTHNVQSFVVADLDNDGDDDVAYLQGLTDGDETSGRHVRILLNFDGQLRETNALLAAGSSQRTLITADFNGDDRADLALPTDSALLVWLGRGDGAFNQLSLPVPAGREAVAGDLDRDGRDELVIGDTAPDKTQRILIYKGSSSGLGATRAIALPSEAAFVSIADVDGDGAKDIVTNDYFTLVVNVVLRAGDPQRYEVRSAFADVAGYSPPLVADLNGDGADELTLYDWVLGVRSLFGSATAQLPGGRGHYVPRLPGTGGLGPGELDAADVDGDADLDIAAITEEGFVVLKNNGDGTLESPSFSSSALAIGDFNGDRRDDVVDVAGDVRLASPNGTFTPASLDHVLGLTRYARAAAGDVNRDGKLDVVYVLRRTSTPGDLQVRLGHGDGTLAPAGPAFVLPFSPTRIDIADFDGDGAGDVLFVNAAGSGHGIAFGAPNGTFSRSTTGLVADPSIFDVAPGDLDGDGDVDLAFAVSGRDDNLVVAYNAGDGTFAPPVSVGGPTVKLELGDVNGDGKLDIVTYGNQRMRVYVNASGTFTPSAAVDARLPALGQIHLGDFNRDGFLDVVATEADTTAARGRLSLLLGDAGGGLREARLMPAVGGSRSRAGDFNGDGATDLLDGGFARSSSCGAARFRAVRH